MANVAIRMMLAKNGKSFPLHLLRSSVSSTSSVGLNLQSQLNFSGDPRSPPLHGDESSFPAYGFNTLLQQSRSADLNRLEVRGKYAQTEDEDDDDDSDFEDFSESDDDFPAEDFDEDEDDDEDEEVNVKRRK